MRFGTVRSSGPGRASGTSSGTASRSSTNRANRGRSKMGHSVVAWPEMREAALRPLAPSGRRFWALAGLLALLVLAGLAAYVVQVSDGLGSAGYSDKGFWGIYEANLVAFIAVSYGGALVSAILRLTQARWRAPITRLAEAMAVFSLLVGMGFALIHLGSPLN